MLRGGLLDSFLQEKEVENVSEKTLKWYRCYLAPWVDLVEPNMKLRLKHYLDRYRAGETKKAGWRAVRSFENWLARREGSHPWVRDVKLKFDPAPEYPVLSTGEFKRIIHELDIEASDDPRREFARSRDKIAFIVLYYTGARLDAIRSLRRRDVDFGQRTLQVRTKGGVMASIYVPDPAWDQLERWILDLPSEAQWVFPSTKRPDKPIDASHLSHLLPKLARRAGIRKRVWVHGLRHAAITEWLDREVPIEVAQRQALHRNIATTLKYDHMRMGRVRTALDRAWS